MQDSIGNYAPCPSAASVQLVYLSRPILNAVKAPASGR
jgi:hypothetical protein